MNSDFNKNQMLMLLHSLDNKLENQITLHIGGGAACIVGHNFSRRSMDIDVLESSPVLESIHTQIKEVAMADILSMVDAMGTRHLKKKPGFGQ